MQQSEYHKPKITYSNMEISFLNLILTAFNEEDKRNSTFVVK